MGSFKKYLEENGDYESFFKSEFTITHMERLSWLERVLPFETNFIREMSVAINDIAPSDQDDVTTRAYMLWSDFKAARFSLVKLYQNNISHQESKEVILHLINNYEDISKRAQELED